METFQQAAIRQAIAQWRDDIIAQNRMRLEGLDPCTVNSQVIHDVFIDAIAKHAEYINCPQDLMDVAFYWKWVDQFGSELYSTISDYLSRPKRTFNEDYEVKKICCWFYVLFI